MTLSNNIKEDLPDYLSVDVFNLKGTEDSILRKKADPVKFPLSTEDQHDIKTIVRKFNSEKDFDIVGLAAPQIGISKRFIIIEVKDYYDGGRSFPKSLWINPTYEKIGNKMKKGYEYCFSVKDMAGHVNRYTTIKYTAFTMDGEMVTGKARGLAARVIQHEVDHLDGKLFIDLVPHEELMTLEEAKRRINEE